jgi:hypothetical protein
MTTELDNDRSEQVGEPSDYALAAQKIQAAFTDCITTYPDLLHIDGNIRKFSIEIAPDLLVSPISTSKILFKPFLITFSNLLTFENRHPNALW